MNKISEDFFVSNSPFYGITIKEKKDMHKASNCFFCSGERAIIQKLKRYFSSLNYEAASFDRQLSIKARGNNKIKLSFMTRMLASWLVFKPSQARSATHAK